MFERAGDLTERLEGDARIERGGIEFLVPERARFSPFPMTP